MPIIRGQDRPVMVDRNVILDDTLSLRAKGLFAIAMMMEEKTPDIDTDEMKKFFTEYDGEDYNFDKALLELFRTGYLFKDGEQAEESDDNLYFHSRMGSYDIELAKKIKSVEAAVIFNILLTERKDLDDLNECIGYIKKIGILCDFDVDRAFLVLLAHKMIKHS